uniref:Uncharacterized protein n=1 Tax=Mycena chlorophos TaxID=658473 RepID=A0ABQ0LN42_MYCCL|nr:predicted protein [Mycena chlorophos]
MSVSQTPLLTPTATTGRKTTAEVSSSVCPETICPKAPYQDGVSQPDEGRDGDGRNEDVRGSQLLKSYRSIAHHNKLVQERKADAGAVLKIHRRAGTRLNAKYNQGYHAPQGLKWPPEVALQQTMANTIPKACIQAKHIHPRSSFNKVPIVVSAMRKREGKLGDKLHEHSHLTLSSIP